MKKAIQIFISFALIIFLFASPSIAQEEPPAECDNGFFTCITGNFADKFPFDIFANIELTEQECPSVTFFFKPFELCFILDLFKIMKYPVIASLLMKIYVYN